MFANVVCKTIHDTHTCLWDFLGCKVRTCAAARGRTPCPNRTTALEKAYDRLVSGFKDCMVEMPPFAEIRDELGLEDRIAENGDVVNQIFRLKGHLSLLGTKDKIALPIMLIQQMSLGTDRQDFCHWQRGRRWAGIRPAERKRRAKC